MRGYSFPLFCTAAALLVLPSRLTESQRVYLGAGTIKANRMSPAYSAIEDAFLLEDFGNNVSTKTALPKKIKKINLKGLKVTTLKQKNTKVRKVALLGEKIEVGHFTDKFITKVSARRSNNVRLAASKPVNIDLSSADDFSSKIIVKNLNPIAESILSSEGSDTELSQASIERLELPSGIVLTKPVEAPKIISKNTVRGGSPVSSITYTSSSETLKGSIEIDGGDVAFDRGNYVYYIERKLDGRIYESGTLSALDKNFQIEVADRLGVLGVELRSLKGDVLAYGEKQLAPIDSGKDSSITLYPSEDLFSGRVIEESLSKGGVEIPASKSTQTVSGVEGDLVADEKGYFNESLFEKGSSFVVETKAQDRWPQISIGVSGRPHYARMLKKTVFGHLSKTADPFGEELDVQTVLMGEVTQLGLAQREVDIRIFNQAHQAPLYFNSQSQVDHSLHKTGVGGKFAFINLPSGGYLVQAYRGESLLAQKWFIVKEGSVSKGQIELNAKTSVVASTEIFPARTKLEKDIVFAELGTNVSFELSQSNESKVDLKSNPEVTVFESQPVEEYVKHIYVTASKLLKKRFRVVHKPWLEGFLNQRRSNANRALGMVVGFIQDEDFKVVKASTTSLSSSSAVYYFDKNGDPADEGLAGGGFIITDVKPGVQTTVVSIRRKEVFLNKVLLAKPYSVSIF